MVVVVLAVAGGAGLLLLSAEFLFFKTQNLNPLQASLLFPLLNVVVRGVLGLSLNLSRTEALSPPVDDPPDDRKGCFGFEEFSGTTLDLVGVVGVTIIVSPKNENKLY